MYSTFFFEKNRCMSFVLSEEIKEEENGYIPCRYLFG